MEKDRKGHEPLEPQVADALLDRLGSDDAFRERFQQDPAAALETIGYVPPTFAGQAQAARPSFGCMQTERLATKEEFQAARAELREHLLSRSSHTVVFAFEADRIASTLRSTDAVS